MNLHAARNMFHLIGINIIEYCLGRMKAFVGYIRTGIYRIEGYCNYVTAENVCNMQQKAWQSAKIVSILNKQQQTS